MTARKKRRAVSSAKSPARSQTKADDAKPAAPRPKTKKTSKKTARKIIKKTAKKTDKKIAPRKKHTKKAQAKKTQTKKTPTGKTQQNDTPPGSDDQPITIELGAVISLAEVAGLKETLMVHGEGQAAVHIKADGVQMIDTAGLQLLLAFIYQLQSQGRPCSLLAPSEVLTSTAALLGLTKPLGIAQ